MISLNEQKKRILSLISVINELNYAYDEDIDYEQNEREYELKSSLFNDFLYHNNPTFTKHVPWSVIPFPRLKKIWEDYMRWGVVRDTRGLEMIEDIMIQNTTKVSIFTNLAGHTQWEDQEAFDENIGYWVDEQLNCVFSKPFDPNQLEIPFDNPRKKFKKPENHSPCNTTVHPFVQNFIEDNFDMETANRAQIREKLYEVMVDRFFDYYQNDPTGKMGSFISDYGLEPLERLLIELLNAKAPEEKVFIIDKMLNVVHQRSDIADWFVEGGSQALNQLSGSPSGSDLNEEKMRILQIMFEGKSDYDHNKGALMRSKSIDAEMKEKILKYFTGGSTYKEGGKVHGLSKPKELTDKSPKADGVSMGADKDGFFVYTHRARSKSHAEPGKIPVKEIDFIESTG